MRDDLPKIKKTISFLISTTIPAHLISLTIYESIYQSEKIYFDEFYPILFAAMAISMLIILFIYRKFLKNEIKNLMNNKKRLICIPLFFIAEYVIFSFLESLGLMIEDTSNQNTVEESLRMHKIGTSLMACITGPVLEEFCYRKFLFSNFCKEKSFKNTLQNNDICGFIKITIILLLSSFLFGFMHVESDFSIPGIMPYFVAGILFGIICDFSGLLLSILTHSISNMVSILLFFYT
ncbi:hypothetical protein DMUE_5451 [Dictyocoela muelleri]|nr:hypothetical protein DMUE_5451 [Dictyocoela muelleri]